MNKKVPLLTKFKISSLNISDVVVDENSAIKFDRTISVKKHKDNNLKFIVAIELKGMIINKKTEKSKDFKNNFEVSSISFFTNETELEDLTPSNQMILCSIAQAYVLTSYKFKELLSSNGLDDTPIPLGMDFDV